jgi:hypothetical protein
MLQRLVFAENQVDQINFTGEDEGSAFNWHCVRRTQAAGGMAGSSRVWVGSAGRSASPSAPTWPPAGFSSILHSTFTIRRQRI